MISIFRTCSALAVLVFYAGSASADPFEGIDFQSPVTTGVYTSLDITTGLTNNYNIAGAFQVNELFVSPGGLDTPGNLSASSDNGTGLVPMSMTITRTDSENVFQLGNLGLLFEGTAWDLTATGWYGGSVVGISDIFNLAAATTFASVTPINLSGINLDKLVLETTGTGAPGAFVNIDNINLIPVMSSSAAVPEPSSFAALFFGGAAFWGVRRRRELKN